MRHLRPFLALLAVAALIAACGTPGSGAPDESNGGGGEATATPDGGGGGEATATPGGGGGGGGANGSITYQITGDVEASGELPFLTVGLSVWDPTTSGWIAWFVTEDGNNSIILNLQPSGQIFTYASETFTVIGTSEPGSGTDCTFDVTRNDQGSGLAGSLDCSSALVSDATGAFRSATVHAEWDAHP
ncbi:MAG: hypothetical protein WED12_00130 [Chloroflexota bacterium]